MLKYKGIKCEYCSAIIRDIDKRHWNYPNKRYFWCKDHYELKRYFWCKNCGKANILNVPDYIPNYQVCRYINFKTNKGDNL